MTRGNLEWRLAFNSDQIRSLVSFDSSDEIFDFILVHIRTKSELSFANQLRLVTVGYYPVPLSSLKRLEVTSSILKELE
jgi:hypothetical protein